MAGGTRPASTTSARGIPGKRIAGSDVMVEGADGFFLVYGRHDGP